MTDFLTAIALVLVLEGLLYAAFPRQMLKLVEQLKTMPAANLRLAGIFCATLGVAFLYFIRGAAG